MLTLQTTVRPEVLEAGKKLWTAEKPTGLEILQTIASLIEAGTPRVEAFALVTVAANHPRLGLPNLVRAARENRNDQSVGGVLTYLKDILIPNSENAATNLRGARLVLISELKGQEILANVRPDYDREKEVGFAKSTFRERTRRDPTDDDLVFVE
jgi:hypothetical protein